jgi:hypothetical protein
MITGESQPVTKETGATVIAGTTSREGSLRVEVTRTGKGTALAGIMRLVGEAQAARSRAQALADRAAFVLTIVAHRHRCADGRRLARLRRDTRLHHHPRRHHPRHRLPDASSRSVPWHGEVADSCDGWMIICDGV